MASKTFQQKRTYSIKTVVLKITRFILILHKYKHIIVNIIHSYDSFAIKPTVFSRGMNGFCLSFHKYNT